MTSSEKRWFLGRHDPTKRKRKEKGEEGLRTPRGRNQIFLSIEDWSHTAGLGIKPLFVGNSQTFEIMASS